MSEYVPNKITQYWHMAIWKSMLIAGLLASYSVANAENSAYNIISTATANGVAAVVGAAKSADNAIGDFIVAAPYIPAAIENKYNDAKYEQNYYKYCHPPEKEIGKKIMRALQTEYTVLWCEETYGSYVNNWR